MSALIEDGVTVGFSRLRFAHGAFWISYFVGAAWRRRGLGARLVERTIGWAAKELSILELNALVEPSNEASLAILLRSGFVVSDAGTVDGSEWLRNGDLTHLVRHHRQWRSKDLGMYLQDILDGYCRIYGLSPIRLNEDGMCRLRFRRGVDVSFEPASKTHLIHIYSGIAKIPVKADVHWYKKLCSYNLYGKNTGRAAVSCDENSNDVILSQVLDLHLLTPERLDLTLQEFVANAEEIQRDLDAFVSSGTQPETSYMADIGLPHIIRL